MLLIISFFTGCLCLVQGLQFLDDHPERDLCIAMIIPCEKHRKPLANTTKIGMGMFSEFEDLKNACWDQAAFLKCMAEADKFCMRTEHLPIADEILEYRYFAFDICRRESAWQQVYLKEARCINEYSVFALKQCRNYIFESDNIDFEVECKYEDRVQDCFVRVIHEKCGYYSGLILHRFLNYKRPLDRMCIYSQAKDEDDDFLGTTPEYDTTEEIFDALLGSNSSQVPLTDPLSSAVTYSHYVNKTDESLLTTEASDSFARKEESKGLTMEAGEIEFPEVPEHKYLYKNLTTFRLYENMQMGYRKYIGCGEADVFGVMLPTLTSKYCIITDLKEEYSQLVFNCSIFINVPCSPEIEEMAKIYNEVSHHRHIVTVLTPPNNQRSDDIAIMNTRYFKFHRNPLTNEKEKKLNLWTDQANRQPKSTNRVGSIEFEDDHIDVLHQHGGSGQKREILAPEMQIDTKEYPQHWNGEIYDEKYRNWDDYPSDVEDIYFPELLRNDIIYIEDDKGDVISLHDHRSPIYSNSLYRPHFLFRPRIGEIPSGDTIEPGEYGLNREKKLAPNPTPYRPTTENIWTSETKFSSFIDAQYTDAIDPLIGMKPQIFKNPNPTKCDILAGVPYQKPEKFYVVTPSAEIRRMESIEEFEEILDFFTDIPEYVEEDYCSNKGFMDKSGDFNANEIASETDSPKYGTEKNYDSVTDIRRC